MNKLFLTLLLFSLSHQSQAQEMEVFNQYNRELNTYSRNGMIALGSWAMGNMVVGTAGALTAPKGSEASYFHLMNASWNVVNLGIAIPAYLAARKRLRKEYDIPEHLSCNVNN